MDIFTAVESVIHERERFWSKMDTFLRYEDHTHSSNVTSTEQLNVGSLSSHLEGVVAEAAIIEVPLDKSGLFIFYVVVVKPKDILIIGN